MKVQVYPIQIDVEMDNGKVLTLGGGAFQAEGTMEEIIETYRKNNERLILAIVEGSKMQKSQSADDIHSKFKEILKEEEEKMDAFEQYLQSKTEQAPPSLEDAIAGSFATGGEEQTSKMLEALFGKSAVGPKPEASKPQKSYEQAQQEAFNEKLKKAAEEGKKIHATEGQENFFDFLEKTANALAPQLANILQSKLSQKQGPTHQKVGLNTDQAIDLIKLLSQMKGKKF